MRDQADPSDGDRVMIFSADPEMRRVVADRGCNALLCAICTIARDIKTREANVIAVMKLLLRNFAALERGCELFIAHLIRIARALASNTLKFTR